MTATLAPSAPAPTPTAERVAETDPLAEFFEEAAKLDRKVQVERVGVAYHESGHAVAARVFGGRVIAMTVDPREDAKGICCHSGLVPGPIGIQQEMVVLAAGDAALELFNFDLAASIGRSRSDGNELNNLARKLHGAIATHQIIDSEIERARCRAAVLVERHWHHIDAIARSLIRHHEITEQVTPEHRVDLLDQ